MVTQIIGFPAAQWVKNMPAMKEMQVRSLSREDPLEKGHGNRSNILVENPMDRGAWQATVHGVAKSWARLKQPSTDACMHPSQRLACCLEESECPHWMGLS